MKNSLRSLVDELEKKEFDRLNVIPDLMGSQGLITDIGLEHVLKPLYYILQERANKNKTDNESYQLVNMGSNEIYGAEFNPVYLFNRKAFNEKLAQVQNVAKAQMKKRLGEQNAS
ncbi:MAG: hypothetical protein EPN85_10265 [Bacteroidetes bacterium]|nr:MAG: hypothetical protein EPN85_10265 [Bacteroidota bacterium]